MSNETKETLGYAVPAMAPKRRLFILLASIGVLACGACSGIAPNVVYATGHDVETKAKLAQAELAACKSDDAQCGPLESDLKALAEDGSQLQQTAVSAGYKP